MIIPIINFTVYLLWVFRDSSVIASKAGVMR